jgi:H+-transporting ATPase
MSLIITLGVLQLTRKHVIVRRLSSLEDLANVNLLLSDKTGTLTQNKIEVESVIGYNGTSDDQILKLAVSATTDNKLDALSQAVIVRAQANNQKGYPQSDFTPADSKRKRATAVVKIDGQEHVICLGAPQVVADQCQLTQATRQAFEADVEKAAQSGYRCLAIASGAGKEEKGLKLIGLLMLSDTIRPEAGRVINFLVANGIDVKMMTGDNRSIAARVATQLGLRGKVMAGQGIGSNLDSTQLREASVFAEILPEDKFNIVKLAAKNHVVAATGDGVNDLPALKLASVGIAVKNAVDALKSSADIVLMTNGIQVIHDSIIEARKIFTRAYYYSVYRISESFRLILSIAIISAIYGSFPLAPIQIIILALLNDLPIITLAYDHVEAQAKPSVIKVSQRFVVASVYGLVGIAESLSLFLLLRNVYHISNPVIQTMFFLKLAVSGHMLIYVVHTRRAWWRRLPSSQIIWATSLTQAAATLLALVGILFQNISPLQVLIIWGWSLAWMQIAELSKHLLANRWSAQ